MSNITLEEIRTELAGFVQDTVDALGYANYGSDYKGKWAAGDYDVETVVSHSLRFYSCLVARTATDTTDPSLDTAAWKLLGSAATIRGISQDNVDALGNSTYGSLYKGLWAAGVHAVGEYRSYGGRYYRCKTARTASNTDSPPMDEAGWEVVGSSFVVQGDIETAKQENIDTAADLVFGSSYRGKWERDSYNPGDVVYDEQGKGFYECDIARTQRNRNPPSVNTSHWSRVDPLNKVVKDSTGLARVKSQAFTSNGTWTKPANVENVRVMLIGGGGGGGGGNKYSPGSSNVPTDGAHVGAGGGGQSGSYVLIEAPVAADVPVTIGAGGAGGKRQDATASEAGSNGGDTSFGDIAVARGGKGGGPGRTAFPVLSFDYTAVSVHGVGGGQQEGNRDIWSSRRSGLIFVNGSVGGHGGGRWKSSEAAYIIGQNGDSFDGFPNSDGGAHGGADKTLNGGGGGGMRGPGGAGGAGGRRAQHEDPHGKNAPTANSGAGGGGGGGVIANQSGVTYYGGNGGNGASGYAVVFWTE